MAAKATEVDADLIEAVCQGLREQLGKDSVGVAAFVRQLYQWVPAEDLAERGREGLLRAASSQYDLASRRAPGQTRVRVLNPGDEWELPHTVIQVVSDDMPFIVDSVTMALAGLGHTIDLVIHPVLRVRRDAGGRLREVLGTGAEADDAIAESVLHVEVAREPDRDRLSELHDTVAETLAQVRAAVEDWQPMRRRVRELAHALRTTPQPAADGDVREAAAFLEWLTEENFTLLGFRAYELEPRGEATVIRAVPDSGLGILRGTPARPVKTLDPAALRLARADSQLILTKANSRSPIHRPAYLDYVGIKHFDADGGLVGEWRLLGLYTTAAFKASAFEIPLLRGKVEHVLARAGFPADSHDAKALIDFLESHPRDALLRIGLDELFEMAIGVLTLGERARVRLFVSRDPLERFVSCLVTIPRERYSTESRERVAQILLEEFGGTHVDWGVELTESILARVHFVVHGTSGAPTDHDLTAIEARLAQTTRAWTDDLRVALLAHFGEAEGTRYLRCYGTAFPAAYRSDHDAEEAVADIGRVERVRDSDVPVVSLYRPQRGEDGARCKLLSTRGVSLSDVLPTFEHMGARVVDERPYRITPDGLDPVWVYDFGLSCRGADLAEAREHFEQAFAEVWRGRLEDDGLNALVVHAGLSAPQVTFVRAVARYLRQAAVPYSDAYIERTLLAHATVTHDIVHLFYARLDPDSHEAAHADTLEGEIVDAIDAVVSLDEDRILRSVLAVVRATVRTSFFRTDEVWRGEESPPGPRPYVAFKLDPEAIPVLPRPRPRFEIYVYSPRFEGIHLRGGRVARGGLRWSERPEDFRTEVLGLMKAQMVKNALIVPVGSKGGFVVKRPPRQGGREALTAEAIACYRLFLSGLLDLTDNYEGDTVVSPPRVVRHDDEDPYLVVAADKGTATFSDIANDIAQRYGFWLGDAFASGGSHGYDHKQMGITARGAWESVKRHFRELGADVDTTPFTVAGIGDMSGDVFGNGMLLSPHIKLVAAFNHAHVFLDPDPDPERSFAARRRLFAQPRSAWSDYDTDAISAGGGVFARTAKLIRLSPQARETLGIEAEELAPSELISRILTAPVDLLWNGGIGTYVKAGAESHADAGDKANDAVRVNGRDLRCRVVGEGGNLGFTQRGRIEFALMGGPEGHGGRINTDAIDNVAGVNTSDHEVNIKILLDARVGAGELADAERNALLAEMTDAVASAVLAGSYTQTQALSIALAQAPLMVDVHGRLIRLLETGAHLDRELEFVPSEEVIAERTAAHQGLLAPEMAVVMAYTKIYLYAQLLDSDLPEDPSLTADLERYFPAPLPERYRDAMRSHRLQREITATVVANGLVDRAGTTFVFRLREETGAPPSLIARAFAVAREAYEMREYWAAVEALDNKIDASVQIGLLIEGRRLVERASRWLLHANPRRLDVRAAIEHFKPEVRRLWAELPDLLAGVERDTFEERMSGLRAAEVPEKLARAVAGMPAMSAALDIVAAADASGCAPTRVSETYFKVGAELGLNWLRDRIVELPRADRWQALGRTALRDELLALHRALTEEILRGVEDGTGSEAAIKAWRGANQGAVERCLGMLADIRASRTYDMTTLPVALREVRHLIRGGAESDGRGAL